MTRILISNDDGVKALGLQSLKRKMSTLGEVFVVAPDRERSTVSHALTLHRPLRVKRVGKNTFTVDGTPSDCVNLALNFILKKKVPDIVVSGINHGANLGDDITYSGTLAAAMEGTIRGMPSIALSLVGKDLTRKNFENAAGFAIRLVKTVLRKGLPEGTFLNVNVPALNGKIPGSHVFTALGKRLYSQRVQEKVDPRGEKYYWIGGIEKGFQDIVNSDCRAVFEGKISVTPIKLDLTDRACLKRITRWRL